MYLKWLDKIEKQFPHTKTRKKFISLYVRKHFSKYSPTTCWPEFCEIFICVDTLVYSPSTKKGRDGSPTLFFCLLNQWQQPRNLLKMYTSLRADVFLLALIQAEGILTSVVNCDLINNMTWTVIRFRKRIANVLCRLSVKHYTVLVWMNVIFQFNSKTTRFHTYAYMNFFFVLMWKNTILNFVREF